MWRAYCSRAAEHASLGLCVCGERPPLLHHPPPAESRISAESQTSPPVVGNCSCSKTWDNEIGEKDSLVVEAEWRWGRKV